MELWIRRMSVVEELGVSAEVGVALAAVLTTDDGKALPSLVTFGVLTLCVVVVVAVGGGRRRVTLVAAGSVARLAVWL